MLKNRKAKRKEEAIKILNKQIGKLDDPNYPASDLWAIQTSSFIKKYFGEDSSELKSKTNCAQRTLA